MSVILVLSPVSSLIEDPVAEMQQAIHDPMFLGVRRDAHIVFRVLLRYFYYQRREERRAAAREEVWDRIVALHGLALCIARKSCRERSRSPIRRLLPAIVVDTAPLATPPCSPIAASSPASLSPTAISSPTASSSILTSSKPSFSNDSSRTSISKAPESAFDVPIVSPVSLPALQSIRVPALIAVNPPVTPPRRIPVQSVPTEFDLAASYSQSSASDHIPLAAFLGRVPEQTPDVPPVRPSPAPRPTYPRSLGIDDLQPLKVLGKGAFGTVYLAKDKLTGINLAVKVIPKDRFYEKPGGGTFDMMLAEHQAMRTVSGRKGLLPLHASWHDSNYFFLATEYCPNGDLRSEMGKWGKIPKSHARFWGAQMIVALTELHSHGIVHRDIKPENILFNRNGHIVLADFGLARNFGPIVNSTPGSFHDGGDGSGILPPGLFEFDDRAPLEFTRRSCGTPPFMAPEIWKRQPYSYGVDYWAMGVVLFVMLTGRMPFAVADNKDMEAQKHAIVNTPLRFEVWDHVDPISQDFLHKILTKNPKDRMTVYEMKAHPFFESIDWELLTAHRAPAPWIPLAQPARSTGCGLLIPSGTPYSLSEDPLPDFTFVGPKLYETPLVSTEAANESHDTPNPKFSAIRKLFSRSFKRGDSSSPLPGALHKVGSLVFQMECTPVAPPPARVPVPRLSSSSLTANNVKDSLDSLPLKAAPPQFADKVKNWFRSIRSSKLSKRL